MLGDRSVSGGEVSRHGWYPSRPGSSDGPGVLLGAGGHTEERERDQFPRAFRVDPKFTQMSCVQGVTF